MKSLELAEISQYGLAFRSVNFLHCTNDVPIMVFMDCSGSAISRCLLHPPPLVDLTRTPSGSGFFMAVSKAPTEIARRAPFVFLVAANFCIINGFSGNARGKELGEPAATNKQEDKRLGRSNLDRS
ncbi:MAG: hypothetical protein KGK15_01990 [Burkholderiales bacterium]|nr:hypothetical protein [Burkholderiales bacterium]